MLTIKRRRFVQGLAGLAGLSSITGIAAALAPERVIRITAKRFEFSPSTILIAAGEAVTLELVSSDVPMGFSVPDLKLRTDIIPGQTARLHIPPQSQRDLPFICDVFCGTGHEDMGGTIKVSKT